MALLFNNGSSSALRVCTNRANERFALMNKDDQVFPWVAIKMDIDYRATKSRGKVSRVASNRSTVESRLFGVAPRSEIFFTRTQSKKYDQRSVRGGP